MKDQLQNRLAELKREFESGQQQLSQLENRVGDLRQTLLRINGAIQVLEELLAETENKSEAETLT